MGWADQLQWVASRMQEPEITDALPIPGELDIPYFDKAELEDHMLIVAQNLLLEITEEELQSVGSDVIFTTSGGGSLGGLWGLALDLTVINVISATIDGEPASEVTMEAFLQLYGNSDAAIYTFAEGRVYFNGTSISLILITEPSLTALRIDAPIFPPGYDNEIVDRTVDRLMIIDFLHPMNLYGGVNNELV